MGVIKGFYLDKEGNVQTYWSEEEIHDPVVPIVEERRQNKLRCRLVRASVYLAGILAVLFTLSLGGSDPNWVVGILGAVICIGWVAVVLAVNGGNLYVEQ